MRLVIIHYHLRPGGVRRIIELATPHLLRQFGGKIDSVVIATGEKPDLKWETLFRRQLTGTPVEFFIAPAFGYLAEQKQTTAQVGKQIRSALKSLLENLSSDKALIWAHNLGIGRNLLLTRELARVSAARKIPLALHHHDWWFDNRWLRWPEMRRAGFRTLKSVAHAIFPTARCTQHLTINRFDALRLRSHFPQNSHWLPNLIDRPLPPSSASVRRARTWLHATIKRRNAPLWILPCRGLRRKNMAEALLLTRWLRPEATLITTGGASSANEQSYFDRLRATANKQGWPLRLGVLQGDETNKPTVAELLAASEAVLLTSIQEGFGLPYLEAAAAARPLLARAIPNIAPDLARLGFKFPQVYKEIHIPAELFDWQSEHRRQTQLFNSWRRSLPRAVQNFVGVPVTLTGKPGAHSIPFSRLTLSAQLEILTQPIELSWSRCAPVNPFLVEWQKRAQTKRLQLTAWPASADEWLSGSAYARRFARSVCRLSKSQPRPDSGPSVQAEFLRTKLHAQQLFPLLWATTS